MDGEIKAGSAVKTLHLSKAIYGRVDFIKKGIAYCKGRTQPGKPSGRFRARLENLDLIPEVDLAPEDRLPAESEA